MSPADLAEVMASEAGKTFEQVATEEGYDLT